MRKARGLMIAGALALAMALPGCGEVAPGGPPPPGQGPPPILGMEHLDLTFVERSTDPVASLVADPATVGDLDFVLTGADADLFEMTGAGALRFRAPPVFSSPRDAGANNVYDLIVTATSRGGGVSRVRITVRVIGAASAVRYVDQVFAAAAPMGNLTLAVPSGQVPVMLMGPQGDGLDPAPLVVAGSDDPRQLAVIAEDFARRGYLVASAPARSPEDLRAIALAMRDEPVPGLLLDRARIAVAGAGGLADADRLAGALADHEMPTFALVAGAPMRDAARHFHHSLSAGDQ